MTAIQPLVLTPGEPAGAGCELAADAWLRRGERLPPFLLIDDPDRVAARLRAIGRDVPVRAVDGPEAATASFADALPVLPHGFPAPDRPGSPDPANGRAVVDAIERAVALVRDGRAAAVVTNPIQKETLYQAGFAFPGHTEFLAHLAGPGVVPVMLLASPELRVVPVTIHIPLAEVPRRLTTEGIVQVGRITAAALAQDFGIARPRLALAGLNPHAGEGGALGREEIEVVAPAVAALRAEGIDAVGPLPADTMFHAEARAGYDVALGMYHDQVLVPLKTLDFWGGVNVTLGLPFVRTSPDHGTALTLAGTGRARPDSLIAALRMAADMAAARAAAAPRGAGRTGTGAAA
ncbi:MAG: 4-hydroxythreonine-4-phosphate dehydrogenase PdxA [Thalassobaculum sp.]|uniref:4-hydroxythreonine-4-phosphate dehydrogenase PdxA n=1 Tax=Thalassobaculum sp. TaxID=2022740 RepID=UPI0032EEA4C7